MDENRILFIVEGESDEVKFLRKLFKTCYQKKEYKIYSYQTNIHVLAQELYNNYPDFEDGEIDIKLILKSLEADKHKRKILDYTYHDIFLIFDFDPQHDHPHFDTVCKMLNYFTDSTDQGKLYINYPMMQSYKHFSSLPDYEFKNYQVTKTDILNYKQLVGKTSCICDLTKYNSIIFYSIAVHHLMKLNYIKMGNYIVSSEDDYLETNFSEIYKIESDLYSDKNLCDVLNTSIFTLIDFSPTKFFNFINKQKNILKI